MGQQRLHRHQGELHPVGQQLFGLAVYHVIAEPEAAAQLIALSVGLGPQEVAHDHRGLLPAGADDGALEVLELFGIEADVRRVAEADDDPLGAQAAVLEHVVGGVPVALLHGQGLVVAPLRVAADGAVVILPVPDGVPALLQAVPGKPEVEHLRGHVGHIRKVGQHGAAVGHLAEAGLQIQIARIKELVQVPGGQALFRVSGCGRHGIAPGIGGHHLPPVVLVQRAVFHGVADGHQVLRRVDPARGVHRLGGQGHLSVDVFDDDVFLPVDVVLLGVVLPQEPAPGLLAHHGRPVVHLRGEHHGLGLDAFHALVQVTGPHFGQKGFGLLHEGHGLGHSVGVHDDGLLHGAHGLLDQLDHVLGPDALGALHGRGDPGGGSVDLGLGQRRQRAGQVRLPHLIGTLQGREHGVEDAGAPVASRRRGYGAGQTGAAVAAVADGVQALHGGLHVVVDLDGALLTDEQGGHLQIRVHAAGRLVVEHAELLAVGAVPLALHGVVAPLLLAELQVDRSAAGFDLGVPLPDGLAGDVRLPVLLEVFGDMLALGVVHEVLAEDHLVMAAVPGQLGKVAELGVAHLGPQAVGGQNAVAPAGAPHGADAVVLAAGGKHHLFGADGRHGAVQNGKDHGAGDAGGVPQQIGHHGLVQKAHALFLRGAAHFYGDVQIHADHGGHGPGGHDVETAVGIAGDIDAPGFQLVDHGAVLGHIAGHEHLIGEVGADVLGVEHGKAPGIHPVREVLQHAAAQD